MPAGGGGEAAPPPARPPEEREAEFEPRLQALPSVQLALLAPVEAGVLIHKGALQTTHDAQAVVR